MIIKKFVILEVKERLLSIKKPEQSCSGITLAHRNEIIPSIFSHPDFTVGFGISPNQPHKWVADYYRRLGLSPDPEELYYDKRKAYCKLSLIFITVIVYAMLCERSRDFLKIFIET